MSNHVETILRLLHSGIRTDISNEELSLLLDLHKQFQLFCTSFAANDNSSMDKIIGESASYLAYYINVCTKTTNNSQTTTIVNNTSTQHEQPLPKLGVVATDIKNGKLVYLLDGEVLKFKKMKDTTVYHHRWEENYKLLREFYNQHGNCRVTRGSEGFEELGNWVMEQRRKLKNGKLSQRQFERLNELGFEWNRLHYFFRTYHGRPKRKRGELTE